MRWRILFISLCAALGFLLLRAPAADAQVVPFGNWKMGGGGTVTCGSFTMKGTCSGSPTDFSIQSSAAACAQWCAALLTPCCQYSVSSGSYLCLTTTGSVVVNGGTSDFAAACN
jgi:hypothetical protein